MLTTKICSMGLEWSRARFLRRSFGGGGGEESSFLGGLAASPDCPQHSPSGLLGHSPPTRGTLADDPTHFALTKGRIMISPMKGFQEH